MAVGCTPVEEKPPGGERPVAGGKPGSALAAVEELTVKGRAPKTGYDRSRFGSPWADTDSNGCGTRDDILARDLEQARTENDCKVVAGKLAPDPYSGKDISFERGRSQVDIDHLVALSDAWQKGAQQWKPGKRIAFANDPLNLLAVGASVNRSKGDGDTATWLPPVKSYRCAYVAGQVAVKRKYGVWVTSAEQDAMRRVLDGCPEQALPVGNAPTVAPGRFHAD
nr:HNH endonuclease family protein [Streptomyces sp. N35]